MRHIAIESGAFVVSVPQYIPASAFPDDFPVPLPDGKEVFGRGGAVICEPGSGEIIAGPLYDAEGMLVADCDLRRALHAKRFFDAVGHYARSDVLGGSSGPAHVEPAPWERDQVGEEEALALGVEAQHKTRPRRR
jgi:nitrilase